MPNKRGSLNNRVGWKFPKYLISGGDGKSKNYVFTANVRKRNKQVKAKYEL